MCISSGYHLPHTIHNNTTTPPIKPNSSITHLSQMVKTIFGGAGISATARFKTKESAAEVLDILLANGVTTLDSARLYAGSEVAIGQQDKRAQFTIDTKLVGGFQPGNVTKEGVIKDAKDSLDRVGIKQFDILYARPSFSNPHK